MCGIGGWVDFERDLRNESEIMSGLSLTLAPRGPDEKGEYSCAECFFVHRRLTVIDPENGKQPMTAGADGAFYTICYNGELYNTAELRTELERRGYTFATDSDTETLLLSFVEWGADCLERLNGIFAFAVWNDRDKTLFLARDRIGVKPLFYHVYESGIIFASEVKTLLAHPFVRPRLDREGIASVILLGPARKPSGGIFNGISSLRPAEYMVFEKEKRFSGIYWELTAEEHTETAAETCEHLRFLLTDAITRQLVSDVPLCTFLSGGLDSSIISAVAAEKFAQKGETLTTYSVDYFRNHENFVAGTFQPDEDAPWAEKMSLHIGSEHRRVMIDYPALADALYGATDARDCAGMADVDSSLYLFCKEVRKSFPVAVSGECADEIFGGYPWYHNLSAQNRDEFPWAQSVSERAGLLRQNILGDINPLDYVLQARRETERKASVLDSDSDEDILMRQMFMLNFYWFMQTLLDRKDRMSMAHGLEVRVPFCDYRIAEYAYNIPWSIKSLKNREKGLVREAMSSYLPNDVAWRKKSPYPKTHDPLYMKTVIGRVSDILHGKNARIAEILDEKKLLELVETEGGSFRKNWYGQLMTAPQLFAYLIQLEYWLNKYNVEIV